MLIYAAIYAMDAKTHLRANGTFHIDQSRINELFLDVLDFGVFERPTY